MVEGQANLRLTDLPPGAQGTIVRVKIGKLVNSRLVSLGFTPGVRVQMMRNYGYGPLIVIVRGTQVALGRGEASKIEVQK